jgi:peptidoglycan hydrolase CwlO-like protein
MIDAWVWGLIASLVILAFGFALKSAQDQHLLNKRNEDLKGLRSEIETLKKHHEETVSGIKQSNATEIEKLMNRIAQLEKQISHRSHVAPSSIIESDDPWMKLQ